MNLQNATITVFGDSISKGIVTDSGTIETVKDNAIHIISKELNIDIKNESMYGQTLARVVKKGFIDRYLKTLDKTKKNIVVLSLGGNDSDYDWKEVSLTPTEPHSSKTTKEEFKKLLLQTITQLKNNGVEVLLTNLPPVNSERYFNNIISKVGDGKKVLGFFCGDISNIQRNQEVFNGFVTNCAYNMNCVLIDIRSCFLNLANCLDYFCLDGIHPNMQGQKLIAKTVLEQLKNL